MLYILRKKTLKEIEYIELFRQSRDRQLLIECEEECLKAQKEDIVNQVCIQFKEKPKNVSALVNVKIILLILTICSKFEKNQKAINYIKLFIVKNYFNYMLNILFNDLNISFKLLKTFNYNNLQ